MYSYDSYNSSPLSLSSPENEDSYSNLPSPYFDVSPSDDIHHSPSSFDYSSENVNFSVEKEEFPLYSSSSDSEDYSAHLPSSYLNISTSDDILYSPNSFDDSPEKLFSKFEDEQEEEEEDNSEFGDYSDESEVKEEENSDYEEEYDEYSSEEWSEISDDDDSSVESAEEFDDVIVVPPRPAKRRLIDIDYNEDEIRWAKMRKLDHRSRFEELERVASEATQRGPEEFLFTHYIDDGSSLIAPFAYPPVHARMKFPLNQRELEFITRFAPRDWLRHLNDEGGFDDFSHHYRFKGSEYRLNVLLKRALVLGQRKYLNEDDIDSDVEDELRRPNIKRGREDYDA